MDNTFTYLANFTNSHLKEGTLEDWAQYYQELKPKGQDQETKGGLPFAMGRWCEKPTTSSTHPKKSSWTFKEISNLEQKS